MRRKCGLHRRLGHKVHCSMVIARAGLRQSRTLDWEYGGLKGRFGRVNCGGPYWMVRNAERLGKDAADPGVDMFIDVVGEDGCLARRQEGRPPSSPNTEIADGEEPCGGDHEEQKDPSGPADTDFKGIALFHAGFADIGSEGGPATVLVLVDFGDGSAGGLEKTIGPVLLVKAQSSGVTADDSLAEDAAGKEAKPLLFQRKQVLPADLGDCGNLVERDAAGQPLLAQVFSKVAHIRS